MTIIYDILFVCNFIKEFLVIISYIQIIMYLIEGSQISVGKKKKINAYDFDNRNMLHAFGYDNGSIKILSFKEKGMQFEIMRNETLKQ